MARLLKIAEHSAVSQAPNRPTRKIFAKIFFHEELMITVASGHWVMAKVLYHVNTGAEVVVLPANSNDRSSTYKRQMGN